jgi:nicotinic acetylcholine receptor, invertebrate
MKEYNIYARPSLTHKQSTNVTMGLSLSQLIDVDEKNQIITTNCWLTMNWVDYKLTWNPTDYGNITEIRLPYDKIWKPDVILYNNADALASQSQISTQMMINKDGNVTWLSTAIFKSSCSLDVYKFPFDEQNCSLLFGNSNFNQINNYFE